MEDTTYSNAAHNVHTMVIKILREDSTLKKFSTTILDGNPVLASRGTGFPYILVNNPTRSESTITIGSKRRIIVTVPITIVSKQEGNVRQIFDKVLDALKIHRNLSKDISMWNQGRDIRSSESQGLLPESSIYVYTMRITVPYVVYGE